MLFKLKKKIQCTMKKKKRTNKDSQKCSAKETKMKTKIIMWR